jgi:sortase A
LGNKGRSLKRLELPALVLLALALVLFGIAQLYAREQLPVAAQIWPEPSEEELVAVEEPRQFPPSEDAVLTLTVEDIGLYDAPVVDSESDSDLDRGVIHLPETPMPSDDKEQKNVYLAAHRVGVPGTTGRMMFFRLDQLQDGDRVVIKDTVGDEYVYEVSEAFVVDPDAEWAVDPVRGRDMLTLQTCTYPGPSNRIIVRADRV